MMNVKVNIVHIYKTVFFKTNKQGINEKPH